MPAGPSLHGLTQVTKVFITIALCAGFYVVTTSSFWASRTTRSKTSNNGELKTLDIYTAGHLCGVCRTMAVGSPHPQQIPLYLQVQLHANPSYRVRQDEGTRTPSLLLIVATTLASCHAS